MIKKIHYCWFGGSKPALVEANIEQWKKLNPDFALLEWNEDNTDISDYEFGRHALQQKRWSFVSDIVRLQKLHAEGGFYLDADVEIIRPLNVLESESDYLIMGYIFDCALGTAVFYSPPRHAVIAALLDEYHAIQPGAWPVNNSVYTDYFINQVPGFLLNGRRWKSETWKISLYPKEFFEQPAFSRRRGLSIHHATGSWQSASRSNFLGPAAFAYSHGVKWFKRKLRTFYNLLISEYRTVYFRAILGLPSHVTSHWKK